MKSQHFQSCDYLYILTPDGGNYGFRGTDRETLENAAAELQRKRDRINRQLSALWSYLDGETESHPCALPSSR